MPHCPLDPQSLRATLEAAGLRCTPQRLAVYDHLARAEHHPTAEEVFRAVRSELPRISLATVYKALEALVETGVAARLPAAAGDSGARYDARRDPHYHFRCLRTGTVHDLPTHYDPELVARLDPQLATYLRRRGFQVTGYRLELVGFQDDGPAARRPRRGGEASEESPILLAAAHGEGPGAEDDGRAGGAGA